MKNKNFNKKGYIFMIMLMLITIGSVATIAVIGVIKYQKINEDTPGDIALTLLRLIQQGEKLNFYLDTSAKYAMRQSVFELASQGGFANKPTCGSYQNYNILYDRGNYCIPEKPYDELRILFAKKLYDFIGFYPLNIPSDNFDIYVQNDKLIAKSKKEFSLMGKALGAGTAKPITTPSTGALHGLDETNVLGYDCVESSFSDSQSIGKPSGGKLENPAKIEKDTPYYYSPYYSRNRFYGTTELVHMIEKTGCIMKKASDVRLRIQDLSDSNGGPVFPHKSHQSGRDVDIGLISNKDGELNSVFYRLIGANIVVFDEEANWLLVKALFASVNVKYIFLDVQLKEKLSEYANENEVDQDLIKDIFSKIRHEPGHDDHYHVRIECPTGDTRCVS